MHTNVVPMGAQIRGAQCGEGIASDSRLVFAALCGDSVAMVVSQSSAWRSEAPAPSNSSRRPPKAD